MVMHSAALVCRTSGVRWTLLIVKVGSSLRQWRSQLAWAIRFLFCGKLEPEQRTKVYKCTLHLLIKKLFVVQNLKIVVDNIHDDVSLMTI